MSNTSLMSWKSNILLTQLVIFSFMHLNINFKYGQWQKDGNNFSLQVLCLLWCLKGKSQSKGKMVKGKAFCIFNLSCKTQNLYSLSFEKNSDQSVKWMADFCCCCYLTALGTRLWSKETVATSLFHSCAAAAAKSLQSCPTLCDPIDGSPPGSAIPGILQARTLECAAISFSNAWKWKVKGKSLSRVQLSDPMDCSLPGSSVHGFSRQEYWSGVPSPSPYMNTNHKIRS